MDKAPRKATQGRGPGSTEVSAAVRTVLTANARRRVGPHLGQPSSPSRPPLKPSDKAARWVVVRLIVSGGCPAFVRETSVGPGADTHAGYPQARTGVDRARRRSAWMETGTASTNGRRTRMTRRPGRR